MKKKLLVLGLLSSFGITNLFAFPYGMFPDICEKNNQELVYTNDNNIILELELPGYNKQDIQINFKNEYITIEAKTNKDNKELKIERNFFKKYFVGSIDDSKIKIEYINGILKLTLPKDESKSNNGKKLEIK